MRRQRPTEAVFLNVPYDAAFEDLFLAYVVGLSALGLRVLVTLAEPNQDRLQTILGLIDQSLFSIHDLSRVELSKRVPRFNMPFELGLAVYASRVQNHRVHVFERKPYRTQLSISDLNGLDAQIHGGTPKGVLMCLRDIFHPASGMPTVPQMQSVYRSVKQRLPEIRRKAGGGSLYRASVFDEIVVAALIAWESLRKKQAAVRLLQKGKPQRNGRSKTATS